MDGETGRVLKKQTVRRKCRGKKENIGRGWEELQEESIRIMVWKQWCEEGVYCSLMGRGEEENKNKGGKFKTQGAQNRIKRRKSKWNEEL